MCLIVDANQASLVFTKNPDADHKPIFDWLHKEKSNGKIVIGGQLAREIAKVHEAFRYVRALASAGKAVVFLDKIVDEEGKKIADHCVSNDAHVIALARISGARLLCSKDKNLHKDFTNTALLSNPKGRVYQNKTHIPLLRRFGHTPACHTKLIDR